MSVVRELELSVRAANLLVRMGVFTMQEFLALTEETFLAQPGAGRKLWKEIVEVQTNIKMVQQASRDPGDDLREAILDKINTAGLPPRVLLGLLEEIKFVIYARI